MNLISQAMLTAGAEPDPIASIKTFLHELAKVFHADRAYVFEFNDDTADNTYVWCKDNVTPEINHLKHVPITAITAWMEAFNSGQGYMIDDMDKYQYANEEGHRILKAQSIDRLVVCPLTLDGKLYGFAGVDNPTRSLMPICMALLQMASNYISVQLRHRNNSRIIDDMTHYDYITGLYNFSVFHRSLDLFIKALQNGERTGTWDVICFNIRRFKAYNSRLGYAAGDKLLKHMGAVIHGTIGSNYLTRTDADRFYCLVEDERAESVVCDVHNIMKRGNAESVDVYAGIYTLECDQLSGQYAMDLAKTASSHAMDEPGKHFCRFMPYMLEDVSRNAYIISHVDEAIEKGWIKTFFQPVYNSMSRKIFSFESLVRWDDPELGFLSPADFIPILETSHLLYKIDLCVLETSCKEINLKSHAGESIHVSVNISRNNLDTPGFHERINNILNRYRVPRETIALEITETALVDQAELIRYHIDRFHKDGYEVWLDDFGSGYSSLSTLQHFDFDLMKLDMQFLRNPTDKSNDIIQCVVDLSKKLGIRCITEGVETKRQLDFLEDLGCCYTQGYFISKPEPMKKLDEILETKRIGIETADDRKFYKDIALANIMFKADPYIGKGFEPTESPKIVTVIVSEGGRLRTLYTSNAGKRWLQASGVHSEEETNRLNNQGQSEVYKSLRSIIDQLKVRGEVAEEYFHDPSFPGKLRIQLITSMGSRKAFLITSFMNENIAADFNFEDRYKGIHRRHPGHRQAQR